MEKLQSKNEKYILYSPDSLKYITVPMEDILLEAFNENQKLFKVKNYRQIQINYFDDINKFRKFILSMREDKNSLPSYATGTYDNGMINAFIENDIAVGSQKYYSKLYMASHELFHIMYLELILKNDYSKRIIWFDEGLAQYFSKEKDYLKDESAFTTFLEKVIKSTKIIPSLNSLTHGIEFCNDNYNGYDLSYIAIKYLVEVLITDELYNILGDYERILDYGNTILIDAFNYYKQKYNIIE